MAQISVVPLPNPERLKQAALQPFPPQARELLVSLAAAQLPPAAGGAQAHIARLMAMLEPLLDAEVHGECAEVSDPETPHNELSDNYFGVKRDDSDASLVTLSKGSLRALYAVLSDIAANDTTLTAVEIGNLLKLPLIHAMLVENDVQVMRRAA